MGPWNPSAILLTTSNYSHESLRTDCSVSQIRTGDICPAATQSMPILQYPWGRTRGNVSCFVPNRMILKLTKMNQAQHGTTGTGFPSMIVFVGFGTYVVTGLTVDLGVVSVT